MIAPDDFADAFSWTSQREAQTIKDEKAVIEELNAWERERRGVRALVALRDLALVALVAGTFFVVCLVWGRP